MSRKVLHSEELCRIQPVIAWEVQIRPSTTVFFSNLWNVPEIGHLRKRIIGMCLSFRRISDVTAKNFFAESQMNRYMFKGSLKHSFKTRFKSKRSFTETLTRYKMVVPGFRYMNLRPGIKFWALDFSFRFFFKYLPIKRIIYENETYVIEDGKNFVYAKSKCGLSIFQLWMSRRLNVGTNDITFRSRFLEF